MSILVAYASKHGATRQLAERLGETLRAAGRDAGVRPIEAAGDPAGYDAYVIGSAVYLGSWRKEATAFVRRHRAVLAGRPVWLFSSGPLGDPPHPTEEHAVEVAEVAAATTAREHRLFTGLLARP